MKPALLTATLMFLMRSGMPLLIRGSVLSTTTCEVSGSTLTFATVTTVPRLKGPATAGTLIESPYGAPWIGPVRYTGPLNENGEGPEPESTVAVPIWLPAG